MTSKTMKHHQSSVFHVHLYYINDTSYAQTEKMSRMPLLIDEYFQQLFTGEILLFCLLL